MNIYDATEQAYKNGYQQGKRDAVRHGRWEVRYSSKTKVWWICSLNHTWKAEIDSRTYGRGCPYCSNVKVLLGYNDLESTSPDLIKEWDFSKNTFKI